MFRPKAFGVAMFVSIATSVLLVVFLIAAAMLLGLFGVIRMLTARSEAHDGTALDLLNIAAGLLVGPAAYAITLLVVSLT